MLFFLHNLTQTTEIIKTISTDSSFVIFSCTQSCGIQSDAMNNRRTQTSLQIYVTLTLLQGLEKGYSRFACERELETEEKLQYFDPDSYGRQRCVFLVLLMLNRMLWGPLCWVLAFFTASYRQLLWSPNSIGVPEGPLGRVWLSLPHLVYNSVSICDSNSTATQLLS